MTGVRAVVSVWSAGTRSMARATAMAVAAARQLLCDPHGERIDGVGADTALVLGTTTGSVQSMMDFIRDSLVQKRPFLVVELLPSSAFAQESRLSAGTAVQGAGSACHRVDGACTEGAGSLGKSSGCR